MLTLLCKPPRRKRQYLLRDEFTTAEAEPITSPRTCEPGPGTLAMVDLVTGSTVSISGGRYSQTRPTGGVDYAKLGFVSELGLARQPGRALYVRAQFANTSGIAMGWANASSMATLGGNYTHSILVSGGALQCGVEAAAPTAETVTLSTGIDYEFAIILRSIGALYLVKGGAQYPAWSLIQASRWGNFATAYPRLRNYNGAVSVDSVRVLDLGGLWALDYGKCDGFDATPDSGDTAIVPADALQFFTWTPATGETLIWRFRRADDDNCYRLECDQAGGTIKLFRRESGSDTELAAGKTQTWKVGTPVRIAVKHAGGQIRVMTQLPNYDLVGKNVATTETFNLTATGSTISGFAAGANWERWPRTFSGDGIEGLR